MSVLTTRLPKLYRVVYGRFEWVHDELIDGDHRQTCGVHYIKIKRVLISNNEWKWSFAESVEFVHWHDLQYFEEDLLYSSGFNRDYTGEIEWCNKPDRLSYEY